MKNAGLDKFEIEVGSPYCTKYCACAQKYHNDKKYKVCKNRMNARSATPAKKMASETALDRSRQPSLHEVWRLCTTIADRTRHAQLVKTVSAGSSSIGAPRRRISCNRVIQCILYPMHSQLSLKNTRLALGSDWEILESSGSAAASG